MTRVKVTQELAASADAVWGLLGDFGGVMKWGAGMLESCEVHGEGVGATRTIGIQGTKLQERLEAFDAAKRTLSYAIVGASALPVENYLAHIEVSDLGGDRCRVDWHSTFEPKGAPEEQAIQLIEGVYKGGLKAVAEQLAAR